MRRSREWIEQVLRRRIREGNYAPGEALPTHRQLMTELGASSATIQHACHRLAELGYVHSTPHGTTVSSTLPHDACIALVLPVDSAGDGGSRFYANAKRVCEAWAEGEFRFRTYALHDRRPDSAAHKRLCQDLAAGGLAGVVFIHPPYYLPSSPIFTAGVPLVCIDALGPEVDIFGMSVIVAVVDDLVERIFARFQAAGRRRLAGILSMADPSPEAYLQAVRSSGLETRPEWWPALPIDINVGCVRDVVRLMFAGAERFRPDCLFVANDHQTPFAVAGVLDAGLRIPADVELALYANFPTPIRAMAPCLHFGPDMRELIRAAVAEVRHLAGGGPPRVVQVPRILKPGS